MRLLNTKGFSLVELLVVVGIVGVLTAVGAPQFIERIRRSKQAEVKILISTLIPHHEAFHEEWGLYFPDFRDIGFKPEGEYNYSFGATNYEAACAGSAPPPICDRLVLPAHYPKPKVTGIDGSSGAGGLTDGDNAIYSNIKTYCDSLPPPPPPICTVTSAASTSDDWKAALGGIPPGDYITYTFTADLDGDGKNDVWTYTKNYGERQANLRHTTDDLAD